jgi:curved DNA-binding protein CbpA
MIFKDYYALLEISSNATDSEIKQAFRKQAIKWHPDRNQRVDTTSKMQDINEANLILKDPNARARYNVEYLRFKNFQNNENRKGNTKNGTSASYPNSEHTAYSVNDDILEKWMNNAKTQAVDLASQTIKDFKGVTTAAAKGLMSGVIQLVIWIVAANLIIFIFKLIKN